MKAIPFTVVFSCLFLFVPTFLFAQAERKPADTIFTPVPPIPSPPGGLNNYLKDIQQHVRFTDEARQKKLKGIVAVNFVVEEDGTLTDIIVKKSTQNSFVPDVVRYLKASKPWNPALQGGKAVRYLYTLSVELDAGQE